MLFDHVHQSPPLDAAHLAQLPVAVLLLGVQAVRVVGHLAVRRRILLLALLLPTHSLRDQATRLQLALVLLSREREI